MIKEKIIRDIKFRQRCTSYGLNWSQFKIVQISDENYIIALNDPIKNIYVLFDKNYNTISMEKGDWIKSREDLEKFVNSRYVMYTNLPCVFSTRKNFGYPFNELTLKQIIDLSNRIEIVEINHGHSLRTKVNGCWYDRNTNENGKYFQLLTYIKFLGEEIKEYFELSYHMLSMGFEMPDVYEYVGTLINKINNCVDINLKNNKRTWPSDIIKSIGKNTRESDMNGILYDITNLLIDNKGFKIKSGSIDELEKIEENNKNKDLSIIAKALLEILKISDEEIKIREENYIQRLFPRNSVNLKANINENKEESKDLLYKNI